MLKSWRSTREAARNGIVREEPSRNSPSSPIDASANKSGCHTTVTLFPTKARATPIPATPAPPGEPESPGPDGANAGFSVSKLPRKPPAIRPLPSVPVPSAQWPMHPAPDPCRRRYQPGESRGIPRKPSSALSVSASARRRHSDGRTHEALERSACSTGREGPTGRPQGPLFVSLAINRRQA